MAAKIGEKVLQGSEEVGAKTAFPGFGELDVVAGEDGVEEGLGEFAGLVPVLAFPKEKAQDGIVVGFTKFGERRFGLRSLSAGLPHDGPSRGVEIIEGWIQRLMGGVESSRKFSVSIL